MKTANKNTSRNEMHISLVLCKYRFVQQKILFVPLLFPRYNEFSKISTAGDHYVCVSSYKCKIREFIEKIQFFQESY